MGWYVARADIPTVDSILVVAKEATRGYVIFGICDVDVTVVGVDSNAIGHADFGLGAVGYYLIAYYRASSGIYNVPGYGPIVLYVAPLGAID